MSVVLQNNSYSTLASDILAGDLSLTVATGEGALFPTITTDYFYVTIDDSVNVEVVKVTVRTGDVFTIVRAQDDTAASGFSANAKVELRLNVLALQEYISSTVSTENFLSTVAVSSGISGDGTPATPITANLITGLAGGQTVIGGTGASENLLLTSTSNATKGLVAIGSLADGVIYNATSGNAGIGTATPASRLDVTNTTGGTLTLSRDDTSVIAGDMVGKIQFYAKDSATATNFIVANIEAQANNTITTDINPGKLIFRTTPATIAATPIERMIITHTGLVGVATDSPGASLDVSSGLLSITMGADASTTTRTNTTNKYGRFGQYHYTNAEEPLAVMNAVSTSTTGWLQFGGGAANMNTATMLSFYTAADNTTLNGTERMTIDSAGNVGIGVATPDANAILDVTSTTKAFMPPRMTETQRDNIASPAAGMVIYNSTTNVLNFHNGTAWGAV